MQYLTSIFEITLSGFRSLRVRKVLITVIIAILVLVLSVAYFANMGSFRSTSVSTTETTQQTNTAFTTTNSFQTSYTLTFTACCNDTTVGAQLFYPISIEYNGSWNLFYWIKSATGALTSIKGNLNGSGSYETTITFYVAGYAQETLCAKATKLDDSQKNLTLSVLATGVSGVNTNSTTASNPTAEVCATMGVWESQYGIIEKK